jgi:hypothetical protein
MDEELEKKLAEAVAAAMNCDITVVPPPDAACEVHFRGHKILALDPGTNHLLPLAPHFKHPLIRGRCFFTLPLPLWNELYRQIGAKSFDPGLAIVEGALSQFCRDHSQNVGFWKDEPIVYDLLRRSQARSISAENGRTVGWNTSQKQLDQAMQIYQGRSDAFSKVARGYAGWLLTSKLFLEEHDSLLEQWAGMVQRWGLKYLGILLPSGMLLPGCDPTSDAQWPEFKRVFEAFFTRWRLQRLAAPCLPVPLRPLLGGEFPTSVLPQVNRAGGAFVLPDTFPIGSRDALRDMLAEAIQRPEESQHLREWLEIVSGDNPGKKPIVRFAQLLELQHYWRIIHHRHGDAIKRKLGVVKEVLADFLGISRDTVHRDLMFITKRLGKGWVHRGTGYPAGPF